MHTSSLNCRWVLHLCLVCYANFSFSLSNSDIWYNTSSIRSWSGVPYTLVPGLNSHFYHCFLYNLFLRSALVSNIFGKWLQDFASFGNPWWLISVVPSLYTGEKRNDINTQPALSETFLHIWAHIDHRHNTYTILETGTCMLLCTYHIAKHFRRIKIPAIFVL